MHTAWIIAGAFFASALAITCTMFVVPEVDAEGKAIVSPFMMTLGEIQTAFYILGCVALGVKLAEEKKTIPAIGFTMMSIAQGVIFVTYAIAPSSTEGLEEIYRIFMSSMFLLIPSMILIAFYSEFPKWLNIMGVAACLPLLAENILFIFIGKFSTILIALDGTGQVLFCITGVCWAIRVLRNSKQEIKESLVESNDDRIRCNE